MQMGIHHYSFDPLFNTITISTDTNVIKDQKLNPVRIAKIYLNEWLCVSQFDAETYPWYIHGLVQEKYNPILNALELRLSCTKPSIYIYIS